jgi:hypothetical protein
LSAAAGPAAILRSLPSPPELMLVPTNSVAIVGWPGVAKL